MSDSSLFKKVKGLLGESEIPPRMRILFRPDRWKYIKKEKPEVECPFCKASQAEASFETLVVYKSESSCILLNKYPYNSGHLLIIPKGHIGDFLELDKKVFEDFNQTLRLAVRSVREIYQPHGVNIGMNLGRAAGAGLPDHVHYHVIPRFNGDLNFFPIIAETKVLPETLEGSYNKFLNYFKKQGGL